jgi:hypothetical protein
MRNIQLLTISFLILFAGCAEDHTQQDEADSASATTPGAAPNTTQPFADMASLTTFRLTMERMDKYFQAQRNVGEALKAMTPAERANADISTNPDVPLEQMVAEAEANPLLNNAAQKAGMSAREYIMIAVAYYQSSLATSIIQMDPKANQDSLAREMRVNPDNVRFLRDNQGELDRKYQALQGEMQRLGMDEAVGQ